MKPDLRKSMTFLRSNLYNPFDPMNMFWDRDAALDPELAQLVEEIDAPFHDLLPSVRDYEPETLWVSPMDAHPNAKATTAFAASIEAALREAYPELLAR